MIINRNTKQRQVVLEELQNVYTHPTASEVLELAQKRLPTIGLATVYRCLDFLQKNGQIIKLKLKDKEARYDGRIDGHAHLVCSKCGDIVDILDLKKITIKSKQLDASGFQPYLDYLEIPGICKKCNNS